MICGTAVFVCLVCGGAGITERPRHASRRSQDVIHFLKTCGEENLQFLLVPARLKKSLDYLDTDGSGELDVDEWEAAINRGLAKRLEQMADERARAARAAEKADAEFSAEFLNAAREVFLMIDKDDSGSLDREEIVASSVLSRAAVPTASRCKSAIGLASRRWRGGRDSEACRDV